MRSILFYPSGQMLSIVVLMVLSLIVFSVLGLPLSGWDTSVFLIIAFCIWNTIAGIFIAGIWHYLLKSVCLLLLLFLVAIIFSSMFTGLSIIDLSENAAVFLAPLLYYPLLLFIMALVRIFVPQKFNYCI